MSAEGHNHLSRKIIAFEKSIYAHGHSSPPVWVTQIYCVVCVEAFRVLHEFRTGVRVLFVLGLACALHVVSGVFSHRLNPEHFGVRQLVNELCNNFCVSFGQILNRTVDIVIALTRKIYD